MKDTAETREFIYQAWRDLRRYNNAIPDDVLDFIRDSALNNLTRKDNHDDS